MGTEASVRPTRSGGSALPGDDSPLGKPRPDPLQDIEAARRLTELLEVAKRGRRQVSAFVASPFGLQGVGVVGSSEEEALIMEVPIAAADMPADIAAAVDTIRFFLDDQLTAERDRYRKLLA